MGVSLPIWAVINYIWTVIKLALLNAVERDKHCVMHFEIELRL